MKPRPWLVVVFVGALVGLVFAGVSTYDFVQHLDRQVHSLHCSFIPGGGHDTGESGCQVAMMSSYSSVLRTRVWGGVPISLPAMAVFAFIGLFALDLLLARRQRDTRATAFLALASALPALTSIAMLAISLSQLGTTCKLCVCIYVASAACLVGSIILWRQAVRERGSVPVVRRKPRSAFDHGDEPAWAGGSGRGGPSAPLETAVADDETSMGFLAGAFVVGVAFVLVPVIVYFALAPDHGRFVGTCDGLSKAEDTYNVMVDVERTKRGVPALEVLDPLCPACKAFEERLGRSGYADKLDRRAILFPLDNTCNWMVTEATHPGACTISEAVLCAGPRAPDVIAWAFEHQDSVREETRSDPGAAARIVKQRFPDLASCIGSPEARSRLNKSLRWAVSNNIRVLTPQLFIDGVKLCDEDVDLGLEYTLRLMLERHAARTLVNPAARPPEPREAMGSGDHGSAAGGSGETTGAKAEGSGEKTGAKAEGSGERTGSATGSGAKPDKTAEEPGSGDPTGEKAGASGEKADKSSGEKADKSSGEKADKSSGDSSGEKAGASSADKSSARPAAKTGAATKKPARTEDTSPPGGDKPVTSPSAVDKPAPPPTDKPVTSPSGADKPVTSPSGADKPSPPSEDKPVAPSATDPASGAGSPRTPSEGGAP